LDRLIFRRRIKNGNKTNHSPSIIKIKYRAETGIKKNDTGRMTQRLWGR
jgi:hypothetical protein